MKTRILPHPERVITHLGNTRNFLVLKVYEGASFDPDWLRIVTALELVHLRVSFIAQYLKACAD